MTTAPKCSPSSTECPRCKNVLANCDGAFAVPATAPQQATPEWGGRLPESLERSLKALYLEAPADVVKEHTHQVRQAFRAICTDCTTLRHMLRAMQAKVSIDEGGTATPAASPIVAAQPVPEGNTLEWDMPDGSRCIMTVDECILQLKGLFAVWPNGIEEMQASIEARAELEPVAWRVGIAGMWEYFRTQEAAQRERDAFEQNPGGEPDEHQLAQPVFAAALATRGA